MFKRALAIALVLASLALAAGRMGFRAEYGPEFSVRAYAEQIVLEAGPVEVTAGLDLRYPELSATPYTALIYEADAWWVGIEVAKPVPGSGWRFALMGGMSW